MCQCWRPEHVEPCLPAGEASLRAGRLIIPYSREITVRQSYVAQMQPWQECDGILKMGVG